MEFGFGILGWRSLRDRNLLEPSTQAKTHMFCSVGLCSASNLNAESEKSNRWAGLCRDLKK